MTMYVQVLLFAAAVIRAGPSPFSPFLRFPLRRWCLNSLRRAAYERGCTVTARLIDDNLLHDRRPEMSSPVINSREFTRSDLRTTRRDPTRTHAHTYIHSAHTHARVFDTIDRRAQTCYCRMYPFLSLERVKAWCPMCFVETRFMAAANRDGRFGMINRDR